MTAAEMAKILYVIRAAYPAHFARFSQQDTQNQLLAWGVVLKDYSYEQASAGVEIYFANDKNGFPPSPGQVIDCIQKTKPQPDEGMSALGAWQMVLAAVRNGIYHAEEEFDKLPAAAQRAIGSPATLREWAQMDEEAVQSVQQSHFLRAYRTAVSQMQEYEKLPQSVKRMIEKGGEDHVDDQRANRKKLPGGEKSKKADHDPETIEFVF